MKYLGIGLLAAGFAALSSGAMAADLYVPPAAAPAFAPASPTDWDGPYIGASVGYGWGTATDETSPTVFGSANTSGWLVGAQAGYNFHLSDQIVAGIEGNLDWDNETGSQPSNGSFTENWGGSIRGRLGIDVGGVLPYIEAGVAFANATAAPPVSGTSYTGTHTGYTLGAGVEFKVSDQLSANVEYRYNNYGNATYNGYPIGLSDSQIRFGLNYHF